MAKKTGHGGRRAGSGRKTRQAPIEVTFSNGAGGADPMAKAAELLAAKNLTPFLTRNLMNVVSAGGQAAAAAARQLREMQKELAPQEKKTIFVSFMPLPSDIDEGA